ncbi:hypothetical protein [Actinocrispum sp. NPDC049592]|uniref:DUF7919 family protein n=1 Tax=Actinocrispum sp. NPDC049592 TaxID=3154835 RepID=UPI003432AEAD
MMTTYQDLSTYVYGDHDPAATVLNVGWLGGRASFTTGDVDAEVRYALLEAIVRDQVNVMRGWHSCELCTEPSPVVVPFEPARDGKLRLGHAEVHVTGADGVVYAAPTLIVHYIDAHNYRPPQQFIDAVMANSRSWGK